MSGVEGVTSHTATKLHLTPAQAAIVTALAAYAVETWREDDGALGIAFTDDGARHVGYFTTDGRLIGDWAV